MQILFVIPYYNHPKTIYKLIEYLVQFHLDILIVDDGSNVESKETLRDIQEHFKRVKFLEREVNGGKGAAIKSGFFYAKEKGYSHIFQIDADMQHDLGKIKRFLEVIKHYPQSLVCGNPIYGKDAPKARLYGRKITNFWVFVNTLGGNLKDTMCGMRIYPIKEMSGLMKKCRSNRMDFDIDILLLAYKAGLGFVWIDVDIHYDSCGISHFNAFRDNVLISKMHARHFFLLPQFIFSLIKKA
ncbi:glycosyltransferase family 2 protein [Helicobacter pullorum]|uniref:glycosyltransferase family 2 protein n=1 Tax=Helicobacter pullorum TaxID=35818 RepID=UPI00174D237E|nr:glycosyltransferase family 2 protein [Helicobacter pullorum]